MDSPLKAQPGDTPKKRKHREDIIVLGTIVLVILTFMMVKRGGSSAPAGQPTADPNAQGDGVGGVAGGGGGNDPYSYLPAMLASLPGQVQALAYGAELPSLAAARKRIGVLNKRNRDEQRRITQLESQLRHLKHPKKPPHPITVHHRAPSRKGRHPATHHAGTANSASGRIY